MSSTESSVTPDRPEPIPGTDASGPASVPAALSPMRLVRWSVVRELWEHRWIYIVPLIVAAVFLFGFVIATARIPYPFPQRVHFTGHSLSSLLEAPFDFASGVLMATYTVIAVVYCLTALHAERSDRSILFWKSLPVSDVTTVVAKTTVVLIILPLITGAIIVVTQGLMFLAGSVVLLGRGINATALWPQIPLLSMWAAVLYHLITVHALYYAPIYGWLLLVSGWARRAPFLWAILPIAAVLIVEKLVFSTSVFAHVLLARLGGGPAALPFPPHGNMPMTAPTPANLGAFLASPGLWVGFAICAVFIAAAVRLRRYQGPI